MPWLRLLVSEFAITCGSESMDKSSRYTDVELGQFKRLLATFLFGDAAAQ